MIFVSLTISGTGEQTEEKTTESMLFVSKWPRENKLVSYVLLSTRHSITRSELLSQKISELVNGIFIPNGYSYHRNRNLFSHSI